MRVITSDSTGRFALIKQHLLEVKSTSNTCSTMAPPKKTWTAEAAKKVNTSVLTDHFKKLKTKRRRGWSKKCSGNLHSHVIMVTKKPPPPEPNSTSFAKKRAVEEAPDRSNSKEKKRRTNWGEGDAKVKLNTATKEWDSGRKCGRI